jgi:diguanylate cyclase (GGDEF)-like protein
VETATRTLVKLHKQADEVRAELIGLRQNLADARHKADEARTVELREANERLVLAALDAKAIADDALANLSELTRTSQLDALTNTANRVLMMDRMHNAIAVARRHGTGFGVFFVDLDDFKQVNDVLGHVAGDEVLRYAAAHLQAAVRDTDTVSRYGGDEFLVLVADLTQSHAATVVARKILAAIAQPIRISDHELHLSASIGIALYPHDATDALTLISRADAAMYHSKRRQRGGIGSCADIRHTAASSEAVAAEPRETPPSNPVLMAHDLQMHNLRYANEQLVLSALGAQELAARARDEHTRQVGFLAMVAHELRSPLTPILTAAELLSRAHANEPLLDQLQALIKGRVAHMTRLIDDLLEASRARVGKFQLERCPVEMTHILNVAIESCRPDVDLKKQHLSVQLPPRSATVNGDPVRLPQIFINLLINASKYTPPGGKIDLSARLRADSIEISVADDGIGIDAEVLPHIFELFLREERAMTVDSRGLGIGLAVVRELVEAHGGTVIATSAGRNLGSRFVVTLPLHGNIPRHAPLHDSSCSPLP